MLSNKRLVFHWKYFLFVQDETTSSWKLANLRQFFCLAVQILDISILQNGKETEQKMGKNLVTSETSQPTQIDGKMNSDTECRK